MKRTLLSLVLGLGCLTSFSQNPFHHCGTDEVQKRAFAKQPELQIIDDEIEAFTAQYTSLQANSKKTRATVYRIPIVVHVIHNGESVGSGANISVAQITSQIAVLNKDYRLKNTDSLPTSHAFWGYTDDCEIEFCLATMSPQGTPTSGIDRFDYNQADYDYNDIESIIKPNTIWDRTKYLNIWVVTLGGTASSLLGYATPPASASTDNDGVVIRTTSFGTSGNVANPYHKGRTATHEIGHYLNLKHIWGDDGSACTGTDNVSDTPNQADENYGCPSFPNVSCSNGPNGEMYMNYMDYVDDMCMKMFTTGQKTRMRAVLTSGGARSSLTSSTGCNWPVGLQERNEGSILSIFPNPSSNHFYIKNSIDFSADFSIEVYNALGQNMSSQISMSKQANHLIAVKADGLPNGTYFVTIQSNSKQSTKSLTIIK
jgi:hypothetical protein